MQSARTVLTSSSHRTALVAELTGNPLKSYCHASSDPTKSNQVGRVPVLLPQNARKEFLLSIKQALRELAATVDRSRLMLFG